MPIFTKDYRKEFKNFRPVSLGNIFSKSIQKIYQ